MHIDRVDPLDLDLDTADALAAVTNAGNRADGVPLPEITGPSLLTYLQRQSDGRPVDGLFLARDGDGAVLGRISVDLPDRENTDTARLRGGVHPDHRGRGVGRGLLDAALALVAEDNRRKVYAGAFEGSPGVAALPRLGFEPLGTSEAIRRIDLHTTKPDLWQQLYDEAAGHAADYGLLHLVGPTPPEMLDDLAVLHEAINDAPLDDPAMERDVWDTDRVVAYDQAMAGRRQTVYRVLARHRGTGEWAGMSMLCVDEFAPATAFQEDTSVVRAHRGHRLGLLMKAEMLRRLTAERPEVAAVDTWNSTGNHHMIAVNERLGSRVVARHVNHRRLL